MTETCPVRRRILRLALPAVLATAAGLHAFTASAWAAGGMLIPPIPSSVPHRLPLRKPTAPRLLVLDPGHGGEDPGAIGNDGLYEKDIVLNISKSIAAAIAKNPASNIRVQLTRQTDVFLSLTERVAIAEAARADMFISVHADSAPNTAARGLSVYTLSEKASDKLADMLAENENRVGQAVGADLSGIDREVAAILCDLEARHTRNTSRRVKAWFVRGVGQKLTLLENPARSANFAVLRSPTIPAMLLETGFLSNKEDAKLLGQEAQRRRIAGFIADEVTKIMNSDVFGL